MARTKGPRKLLAVIDESGGNRPRNHEDGDFTLGVTLFDREDRSYVADRARALAAIVMRPDFKYRDVQESTEARRSFLQTFNLSPGRVLAYAMNTAGPSVARTLDRNEVAVKRYAQQWRSASTNDAVAKRDTETLFREVLQKSLPQMGYWAVTTGHELEVFWDDRSDVHIARDAWECAFKGIDELPQFSRVRQHIRLGGTASGELNQVARFAGVLAGDVRQFFKVHGPRIYKRLDETGLAGVIDPNIEDMWVGRGPRQVANVRDILADPDFQTGNRDTCMLQGYYKSFLYSTVTNKHLMSLASPSGIYAILAIAHGYEWAVHQLGD